MHSHHQNYSCIKMGSEGSRFNMSLILRGKVTNSDSVHKPQLLKKEKGRCEIELRSRFYQHNALSLEQIQGNVLSNATKHKETRVHKCFRQKLSASGVRRETDNKRRRKQVSNLVFYAQSTGTVISGREGSKKEDRQERADVQKWPYQRAKQASHCPIHIDLYKAARHGYSARHGYNHVTIINN